MDIFHNFERMEIFSSGKLSKVKNRHAPEAVQTNRFS